MTLKSTFWTVVGKIIFSKQMKLQIVNRPPLAIPLGRGRQLQFCKYTENTDANTNVNNCNCKYTDVCKYNQMKKRYIGVYAQLAGHHWLASFTFQTQKKKSLVTRRVWQEFFESRLQQFPLERNWLQCPIL